MHMYHIYDFHNKSCEHYNMICVLCVQTVSVWLVDLQDQFVINIVASVPVDPGSREEHATGMPNNAT